MKNKHYSVGIEVERVRQSRVDYARLAGEYDRATRWIDAVRATAVARLALRPGETVADLGCGTGFCLPLLARAVAEEGNVYGVESSADMLYLASARVDELANVVLMHAPAERARLPSAPDALLFSFAHDVLQSRAALDNVLAQAKPSARVVAVGSKLFPWWLAPANLWFLAREWGYVTSYRGFARPWRVLAGYLDAFEVRPLFPGNKYLASGRVKPRPCG